VRFVSGAEDAKYMVLCGKTAEEKEGSLYLLSLTGSKEQIVKRTAVPSLDLSRRYFDLELQNVAALQLGTESAKGVFQVHGAVVASELAGIAAKVVEMTVEYVKTRKQFNVPIGTFQAVQHKIADMYLQSEALRALSTFACWAAQHSQEQAQLSTLSALSFACEQAPLIAETAIQMHGGIGFTWEYELHLYLRRAKMVEMLYRASAESAAQIISAV
jgi:alkylation response protein AidB-like acyl-CoA dehydrogenase